MAGKSKSTVGGTGNAKVVQGKGSIDYRHAAVNGQLSVVDEMPNLDPSIAGALSTYSLSTTTSRRSLRWSRTVNWIQNFLFLGGAHYLGSIMSTRLTKDSSDNLSLVKEATRNLPKPTNDILGRFTEVNVSLLTENRPRPRVTPKSDRAEDQDSAELSELTLEYLWETLDMPHKHRQIARLILATGVCWMENCFDATQPRWMKVPELVEEQAQISPQGVPGGAPPVQTQAPKLVQARDENGKNLYSDEILYGDITSTIVSSFELVFPETNYWGSSDLNWVMKEGFMGRQACIEKFTAGGSKMGLTKAKGWNLDDIEKIGASDIQNLPIFWWHRLGQLVEGGDQTYGAGAPELWDDHVIVRTFDRKPSAKWPRGRTIITIGDSHVVYDSPKKIGARAYDPRWPNRWHPYTIFRWECLPSTDIWCRSLVTKLLPKIKRVASIDVALIMWRRTVPIASWIVPKGTSPVEDFWSGGIGGQVWEYDPRRTATAKPEPIYPPPFPSGMVEERQTQMAEMEMIAGTEEIMRGQRPAGTTSAAMLQTLRRQVLASRSAILQSWDESLQHEGTALLQETIKHIDEDPRYVERLSILAREKQSKLAINTFSGHELSDNVLVRVDTASLALVSKEAREAKALEFLQYAPGLMSIPQIGLRQAIIEELGFKKSLTPQGPDVERAKKMISLVKQDRFDRVIPFPEDDPYVFHELIVNEVKADSFFDLPEMQQGALIKLVEMYQKQISIREEQKVQQMIFMAQLGQMNQGGQGGKPPGGGRQQ